MLSSRVSGVVFTEVLTTGLVEFSEYRSYSPGDDLRYLDWKLLARSDRYHIKKYEDETNLRCMICLDRSKSMLFASPASSRKTTQTPWPQPWPLSWRNKETPSACFPSTPRSNPTFRHETVPATSGNSSRPWRNLAREHRPLWKTP